MYSYLEPQLVREIVTGNYGSLSNELYYIGAIGDLIFEIDRDKELITHSQFLDRYNSACLGNSHFYFQEVSKDELILNMFINYDGEMILDPEVNRSDISPHLTINYLALKPNSSINFWEDDVLQQMMQFFYAS